MEFVIVQSRPSIDTLIDFLSQPGKVVSLKLVPQRYQNNTCVALKTSHGNIMCSIYTYIYPYYSFVQVKCVRPAEQLR